MSLLLVILNKINLQGIEGHHEGGPLDQGQNWLQRKCPMPAFTLEISFLGHQGNPGLYKTILIVALVSPYDLGVIFCFAIMALERGLLAIITTLRM